MKMLSLSWVQCWLALVDAMGVVDGAVYRLCIRLIKSCIREFSG